MRGVVLPKMFRLLDFSVIAPPLQRCKPGRLVYSHTKVGIFLERRGCNDIAILNKIYKIHPKARGDIDFAALKGGTLLVGEVKTRLIIKYIGRWFLRDMLLYHLAEPGIARKSWELLEAAGIVSTPSFNGKVRPATNFDSPASIGELARSVAGLCMLRPDICRSATRIVVAALSSCYAQLYLKTLFDAIKSTASYIAKCLDIGAYPAVILVYPDPKALAGRSLERVGAKCYGIGCEYIGMPQGSMRWFGMSSGCTEACVLCTECRYLRICSKLCRQGLHS